MATFVRGTFYRLEQTGNNQFVLVDAPVKTIQAVDIKEILPVNTLGGPDVGGCGYLYSKVVLKQPGLNQEMYALQTVLQMQTLLNS